jgi:hypothetical protein
VTAQDDRPERALRPQAGVLARRFERAGEGRACVHADLAQRLHRRCHVEMQRIRVVVEPAHQRVDVLAVGHAYVVGAVDAPGLRKHSSKRRSASCVVCIITSRPTPYSFVTVPLAPSLIVKPHETVP